MTLSSAIEEINHPGDITKFITTNKINPRRKQSIYERTKFNSIVF